MKPDRDINPEGSKPFSSISKNPEHSSILKKFTSLSLIGALITGVLIWLDPRELSGEPVWLKPLKFFISMSVFTLTLDWGLSKAQEQTPRLNLYRKVVVLGLFYEITLICIQAVRGVKSHFNYASPIDIAIFLSMGVVIAIVVVTAVVASVLATSGRTHLEASEKIAFRWGMILFGVAGFLGYLMPQPSATQMNAMVRGERLTIIGSHFVGSEEGLTRLAPLTGWSLEAGDLRVAHFFGMHAVQLLLLWVLFMKVFKVNLDSKPAENLVKSVAILLGGVTLSLLVEAYLAQSTFNPRPEFWIFRGIVLLAILVQAFRVKQLGES
jgi:hypothetical protein